MSNAHVDPLIAQVLDSLQPLAGRVQVIKDVSQPTLDAARLRIQALEQHIEALREALEQQQRATRSLRQRLLEAVPDGYQLDLAEVYPNTLHGPVQALESVVVAATAQLRARHALEFLDLMVAEYRRQQIQERLA